MVCFIIQVFEINMSILAQFYGYIYEVYRTFFLFWTEVWVSKTVEEFCHWTKKWKLN